MSDESETKTSEADAPAHAADTLPPASEDAGLSDAELSAKRGLSHRDGDAKPVSAMARIAARREAMRTASASAKEDKAP